MKYSNIPKVTVIIPSYNHKRYIVECLDGIKKQTFRDFQWIVVDDGSKDGSPEFLSQLQPSYGYELFLQQNKGVSATLTDMIKNHAKGKYVACCASDDMWLPDKLQKQVDYMDSHPECCMCFGRTYRMDEDSKIIGEDYDTAKYYRGGRVFEDIITQRFHPPVNYMIRKDALASIGYFPQGILAEDFYMNCKLSHDYEIGYIPEFLSYYRIETRKVHRDPYILLKSHMDTIQLYKTEEVYKQAIRLHHLRSFCWLSGYKKYKLLSLKHMMKSIALFYHKLYILGVYYLLFRWKSLKTV